jgi:hypothetical protein
VQLAFPALQELPLLASSADRCSTELIVAPETALTKLPATNAAVIAKAEAAPVLSPSQVRCFFDCQARWWFKYGLQLPERKNSSLALGLAVHQALEVNFREKIETQEDLETTGVVIVFREAWMEQVPQTEFMPGESQGDLRRLGERLVAKYMDEVAPKVEPAAVELDVHGEIAGVAVRGRVDVLDVEGRLIDFKTASRPPSCVSPDYARSNSPLTSDHSRRQRRSTGRQFGEDPDCPNRAAGLHRRRAGYQGDPGPLSHGAESHGLRDVLSEPAVHAVQPQALQLRDAVPRGVRRPRALVLTLVPTF